METGEPEEVAKSEFGEWLTGRPKWLQTAATRLAASKKLPDEHQIRELADFCLAEAKGTTAAFEAPPSDLFPETEARTPVTIRKLDKVIGINAIRTNACLDFGEGNLVCVFGMNGSGKSGYAKLLKHVCGARHRTDILPNVFAENKTSQSCEVAVARGGKTVTFPWTYGSAALSVLRTTHLFDSMAADAYIDSKSEASYEPRRMRFLTALVSVADAVTTELADRKAQMVRKFPTVPSEYSNTAAAKFITELRSTTAPNALDRASEWSREDDKTRHETEMVLRQVDPGQRERQLAADRRTLKLFQSPFETIRKSLSREHAAKIVGLRIDAAAKRQAASRDAAKVFEGSALDGIGSKSWQLLWRQAREFSEGTAYPTQPFPVVKEGGLCVLCHQPLNEEARRRLATFESFVKGGLEAEARTAEKAHQDAVTALPTHFARETWDHNTEVLKVSPQDSDTAFQTIGARLEVMANATTVDELPIVDFEKIASAISAKADSLRKESVALTELQKEGKKEELETTLRELNARHWFSSQKEAAKVEIVRLHNVRAIDKAITLAKTNAITSKKNELAKQELASGYQDRFSQELKKLGGGRISVEPSPVSEGKGRVSFKLCIKGATLATNARVVLSEGENRIVALAAFLADITGADFRSPFIFDDPVSSLDQEFEERVADRLNELAKSRQVIVFTHRLSLLALLEDVVTAEKRTSSADKVGTTLSIVTLRRIGESIGHVDDLNIRHKKPKSGFITLRDHKLPQLRKLAEQGDSAGHDSAVKSVCGDLRILVERLVEKDMFDGVIERFRRSIQTQQIKSLTKITVKDCALIDEMMTKYSRFEHSQPDELPAQPPGLKELAEDIDFILAWIDDFKARST